MLVVWRNVDNAIGHVFAQLACAYLPQYVREHRDVRQQAFQVGRTLCMIVRVILEKVTLQDPKCGTLFVNHTCNLVCSVQMTGEQSSVVSSIDHSCARCASNNIEQLAVKCISCMNRCDRPVLGNGQHAGRNASADGLLPYSSRKSALRFGLRIEEACLTADRQRKVDAATSNDLIARYNNEVRLRQTARTTQHNYA